MNKLKPCPLCGGISAFVRPDNTQVKVYCTNCEASTRYYITEYEVARLWNSYPREAEEAAHKEFRAKARAVAVALVGTHYDGFACHCLACKSAREILAETEKEAI